VQPTNNYNHFVAMGWPCRAGFIPFGQSISDTCVHYNYTLKHLLMMEMMYALDDTG